jgi:hypothetical protein
MNAIGTFPADLSDRQPRGTVNMTSFPLSL